MIGFIKNLFKKEETFSCIVFDGKKMRYLDLTQKQIDDINNGNKKEYEGWTATKKDEC
ncbi:MAG: hypothetical protein ABF301_07715 [Sulfurovum sp.]|jgi:hypothetical protein